MSRLMEAFREGADSNDALRAATGLDFEEFQQAWWEWLGGAPGGYPTPPSSEPAPPTISTPVPEAAAPSLGPAGAASTPEPGSAPWPCAGAAVALVCLTVIVPASRGLRHGASGHR